jgi:hypothetical protein
MNIGMFQKQIRKDAFACWQLPAFHHGQGAVHRFIHLGINAGDKMFGR